MTNGEVWQLCLDDRKVKLEELQKEAEQVIIEYNKASFEESMYAHLKDTASSRYRQTFADKHEIYVEKANKLDERKTELNEEKSILQKEIDYIEGLLK